MKDFSLQDVSTKAGKNFIKQLLELLDGLKPSLLDMEKLNNKKYFKGIDELLKGEELNDFR